MRNQYAGKCFNCGIHVPVGEGFFERVPEIAQRMFGISWKVRCYTCARKGSDKDMQGQKYKVKFNGNN